MLLRKIIFILIIPVVFFNFNIQLFPQSVSDPGIKSDEIVKDKNVNDTESDKSKAGIKLGKIVVTPTKTGHKVGDSPASVTVIDSEDLKLSSGKHLDEAMKSVPGVYLKRSKISDTSSSVVIRGFKESGHNLIMWNGLPLNDSYNSSHNWGTHSLNATDSIEIVKGPFSSLYGKNAIGGVINIITKTPEKQEFSLKTGYGTYNTFSGYAGYGDKYYDCLSVFLAYDVLSTDGTRNQLITKEITATGTTPLAVTGWEATTDPTGKKVYLIGDAGKNSWRQWVASGKFSWLITADSKLDYSFKLGHYSYEYNNPRSYLKDSSGYSVTSGDFTFNDSGTDYTSSVNNRTFLPSIGKGENETQTGVMDYSMKAGLFSLAVKLGYNKKSSIYASPAATATFEGGPGKNNITDPAVSLYGDMQVDISLPLDLLFTLGWGIRQDHAEGDQWNLYNWKDPESKKDTAADHFSEMEGSQLMTSLYSQLECDIIKKMLILYLGARFDRWKNYDGKSRYNITEKEYSATTDWNISPRASIVFKPGLEALSVKLESLKASAGSAYNPPTIYQLYKYWMSGTTKEYNPNPELKPEKSFSWEAGGDISFFSRRLTLSGTYFASVIENLIYNKVIAANIFMQENAGRGEIHGYELEGRLYLYDYFELYGNMTKTMTEITENDTDPVSVGKQFEGVPEMMYNAGIRVLYKYADACLNWRYSDKVYGKSDNSDVVEGVYGSYDSIKLLDLKVSLKPRDNIKFSLSVNNILGREYYQYYLCEGRNFFWEAEIKI